MDLDGLRVIKIIAARNYLLKDGLVFGSEYGSGLGLDSARARDYFSRALFGLGSVQGPDRGWLKVGARLRTRLGLAWHGSGSVSHSALFDAGLARSLAQLGSVLTSVQLVACLVA